MSTHSAIATTAKGVLEQIQLPTPEPKEDEVLVKVEYSSVIAFDTYQTDSAYFVSRYPVPLGLNASGKIVKLGPSIDNLKIGDRVTTCTRADDVKGKAMQEYALVTKYSVCKIPDKLPLPEAATIPDNFVTAYWALFSCLRLPLPTSLPATSPPAEASTPFLIYGSGTTAGQYLIQVLKLAGYTCILTTASPKHHEFLRSLGATDVLDYSQPDLTTQILAATKGQPVKYVVDCITAESSLRKVAEVVGQGSVVALLLPVKEGSAVTGAPGSQMWMEIPRDKNPFSKEVEIVGVLTFTYQQNRVIKETLLPKILPKLLAEGHIKPNRVRLLTDGTLRERAETALDLLRHNKISGEKIVIKIASK